MSSNDAQTVVALPVEKLRLDPKNPRLPPSLDVGIEDQRVIANYINKHFDPLKIAESIDRHRFFESEPLIAVAKDGVYVVIEGNRRLTALMGLADPSLREDFARENRGWSALSGESGPSEVPVLLVSESKEVAALLGYRHISGIEPWDPYAQARYIANLVDDDEYSLDQVGELVGRPRTEVASKYRDYDILEQANSWGLKTERARQSFGVFNNAMGRLAIRKFIGAPDPRSVDPDYVPLPDGSKGDLKLLLHLVFGDEQGRGRVVYDSRQLGDLAKILAVPDRKALGVLLETGDLSEALEATEAVSDQFDRLVRRAHGQLKRASSLRPDVASPETLDILGELAEIVEEIRSRNPVQDAE